MPSGIYDLDTCHFLVVVLFQQLDYNHQANQGQADGVGDDAGVDQQQTAGKPQQQPQQAAPVARGSFCPECGNKF